MRSMTMGVAALGLIVGGVAMAGSDAPCPEGTVAGTLDAVAAASSGVHASALQDGRLVVVDRAGERRAYDIGATGVPRHLSVTPGAGAVLVDDVRGDDVLVLATAAGIDRLRPGGEIAHPDLSATGAVVWSEDLRTLRLRAGGEIVDLPVPRGAAAVFSPVFAPDGSIVAAVEEAVEAVPVEGEAQSNLWRYDPATGGWARLTSFRGSEERWTAVRTPVIRDGGEVLFVRLTGDADATRPAAHELWRVDAAGVEKLRDLPERRFLAGVDGEALLWNDEVAGEWRLRSEGPGGTRDLGCGRTMVDPVSELDPDLVDEHEEAPPATGMEELTGGPSTARMAIVVGDFATRAEASAVAADLGGLRVITHQTDPGAVAPGAFAVAKPLAPGADLEAALDAFRARFPALVDRSWVTALG